MGFWLHVPDMLSNLTSRLWHSEPKGDQLEAEALSHERIFGKCIEATTHSLENSKFLPLYWQTSFLHAKTIQKTLANCKGLRGKDVTKFTSYVTSKARTVFLLLVFIDKVNYISDFHDAHFEDGDLPIVFDGRWEGWSLKNQSRRHSWQFLSKWTSGEKDVFASNQWVFLAPIFSRATFFYELEPQQPLPFRSSADVSRATGYFSTIYRVAIPSSHLYEQNTDGYHEVALKCLVLPNGPEKNECFLREKQILEKMRELQHPHLIQAHSAYHRGKDMGFVFPYAKDGSLAHFWIQHDPVLSLSLVSWALIQMKGLAHGIEQLHGTKTRHGDIRPQNILIFENTGGNRKDLVVADMAIAKYRALYAHEPAGPRKNPFGSRRYEPPEAEDQSLREVKVQQLPHFLKYDLWSLGCVFLEFLIWLDSGAQGLMTFLTTSRVNRGEPRFWEREAVRPEIIKCMDKLEERFGQMDQQYAALKEVLNLIWDRLLIMVDERADSTALFNDIKSIESRFSLTSGDHFDSPPRFLPRGCDGATDTVSSAAVGHYG
ncbi:kinase-like domain-containing protein [Xylaria palmicola]|nr:kinase-like domain-containing protein [Xylaria palmicola]